jgi:hypothetical protein
VRTIFPLILPVTETLVHRSRNIAIALITEWF